MSKYDPLTEHLDSLEVTHWNASFTQIEEILGFKLPSSAYTHRPWWANSNLGHSQSNSWGSAGWNTSDVDLENQTVTFTNFFEAIKSIKPYVPNESNEIRPLTIASAKAGLAANFNIDIENIEIIIRG